MTLKRKIQLARELAEASPEDRADVMELLKDKLPKQEKVKKTRKRRAKKPVDETQATAVPEADVTMGTESEESQAQTATPAEVAKPKRHRGPNKPKGEVVPEAATEPADVPVESDEDIVKKVLEGGI